jgi:hypothetical protein
METEKRRAYKKAWQDSHKGEHRASANAWYKAHRKERGITPRKIYIDPFPGDLDISKL